MLDIELQSLDEEEVFERGFSRQRAPAKRIFVVEDTTDKLCGGHL
jgi:hypothetical protein